MKYTPTSIDLIAEHATFKHTKDVPGALRCLESSKSRAIIAKGEGLTKR